MLASSAVTMMDAIPGSEGSLSTIVHFGGLSADAAGMWDAEDSTGTFGRGLIFEKRRSINMFSLNHKYVPVRLPVSVRIFRILGRGKFGSRLGLARNFFFHVAVFIIFLEFFLKLLSLSRHFESIGGR